MTPRYYTQKVDDARKMTEENFNRLMTLLDGMSKKLTILEQTTNSLDREILRIANYVLKLEDRIRELESDSNV